MNKRTKIISGVASAVIVIGLIAAQSARQASDTGNIRIGGAFMLTGPAAQVGELQKNSVQMAIDEINTSGGIDGRSLELVIQDTAFDPRKTVDAYQALKREGIQYYIADGSPVAAPIRKLAVDDGNFVIVPGATTPAYFDGSNLSCRLALTARNFGPAYADLIVKKGLKSAVVLLPDNEYGKGLEQELTKAFSSSGLSLVATEFYNAGPAAGDYRTNIAKLKAKQSDADAMIFVQTTNTAESTFKQIRELGWKKPIVSDYYTIQNPALKNLAVAEGVDHIDYEYSREVNPNESGISSTFKASFEAKFGAKPVYLAAAHYDAVRLIAEAIEKVGDNPKKVADYISSLRTYQAVTGSLAFNDDCEVDRKIVYRTVAGGKIIDLK